MELVASDVGDLDNSRRGAQIGKVASEDDRCFPACKAFFHAMIVKAIAKTTRKDRIAAELNSGIVSVPMILISWVECPYSI